MQSTIHALVDMSKLMPVLWMMMRAAERAHPMGVNVLPSINKVYLL